MADSGKRKASDDRDGGSNKKKKKGNSGKWKMPKREVSERSKAHSIEAGDNGIWVTCALHMKGKAAREMEMLFDHYAEKFYGIKPELADADGSDEDEGDIEAAIKKEVGNLKDKDRASSNSPFTEVRINQECLLFMKCKAPVEPVDFCRRISQDALKPDNGSPKARYLNRLTPISVISNATENGLEKGARLALADHFKIRPKETVTTADPEAEGAPVMAVEKAKTIVPVTFAIRPSIRNHSSLKRDNIVQGIANLVDPQHRVNLGAPEKYIVVEIYQTVCGISVIPGDWEALKRYNLTELYKQANSVKDGSEKRAEGHIDNHVEKPQNQTEKNEGSNIEAPVDKLGVPSDS